jgi:signal transduction histidine kinase
VNAVIASSDPSATLDFQSCLTGFDVYHFDNAEALLLEINALEPRVVVIHDSLHGAIPAPDVAALLSRRLELRGTWVVGIGSLSRAPDFYNVGALDFEPEPLDVPRFTARLGAAMRSRQGQLEATHRVEQLEARYNSLLDEERLKDRLTHMLVHDLKNPIGAIMGAIDFVRADATKFLPVQHRQLIEMAFEESQHLLHMATNILDVRKMRDGKLSLEQRPITTSLLMRILKTAADDIGGELKHRRTRWRIPDELPIFAADPEVLRRVFANLISNAVKHTENDGRVQIEARGDGDFVEMAVHDDGEGIPEEDLERIFNDFERSRVTNTTRFDTGMGLAFCKLAVEQHGGRIWARSARGRGSSFFFTLPLHVPSLDDDVVELLD